MNRLKKALQDYADFIKPYFLDQIDLNKTINDFQKFSKQYVINQGLSESQADAYEAGNASVGNVNGLMRYWRKKLG